MLYASRAHGGRVIVWALGRVIWPWGVDSLSSVEVGEEEEGGETEDRSSSTTLSTMNITSWRRVAAAVEDTTAMRDSWSLKQRRRACVEGKCLVFGAEA